MIRKTLAILATAACLVGPAHAETYKLAVTDVEGLERLQTDWGPFKEQIEKATGETFEFFPVSSRTAAAEALKAKRLDFVITGPAEYVVIHKLTDAKALIGLSRPDYFCAIVVLANSGIEAPVDIKGKKVGLDDIGSTSGHLCPSQLLADYGVAVTKDLGGITHTSRQIAHEALKRGDVAAIGVNYNSWLSVRNKDKNSPSGTFRVIARSGDLPDDLILAGSHVDQAVSDKFVAALIKNKADIVEGILSAGEEQEKYRGMNLVAKQDSDYDVVRRMYETIGYPQFGEFLGK